MSLSTKKRLAKQKLAALKWVNEIRLSVGLRKITKLPPGIVGDDAACTLANALTGHMGAIEARVDPEEVKITIESGDLNFKGGIELVDDAEFKATPPPLVSKFIDDFDEKKYPELIE